LESQII